MSGPVSPTAVVVMAYGTPRSTDELAAYYTDIRHGRPPSQEQLDDLRARYDAIGGLSPLRRVTQAQAAAIQAALDDIEPDRFVVSVGLKHADPSIEDAVAALDGFGRAVGLVLAPQWSALSVGQYLGRFGSATAARGIRSTGIGSWATEPAYIEFIAADLQRRIDAAEGAVRVLFTAHSLPERILATDDPYPDEVRSTAEAIADHLGLHEGRDWHLAWQSAGRTPEPWIGPHILDVIDGLGDDGAVDTVIVAAIGFVADHLEVLFDLDIEARDRAEQHGLSFDRTASVNDHPAVMAALARLVAAADHDLRVDDD